MDSQKPQSARAARTRSILFVVRDALPPIRADVLTLFEAAQK